MTEPAPHDSASVHTAGASRGVGFPLEMPNSAAMAPEPLADTPHATSPASEATFGWAAGLVFTYLLMPIVGGHGAGLLGMVLFAGVSEELARVLWPGWLGLFLLGIGALNHSRGMFRSGATALLLSVLLVAHLMGGLKSIAWSLVYAAPFYFTSIMFWRRSLRAAREDGRPRTRV